MHKIDHNRVEFYSIEDMAGSMQLRKGEEVLRREPKSSYSDINDIIELYNIKKYLDNELYLNNWNSEEITDFKSKVSEYGKKIGEFMSTINDDNIIRIYEETTQNYTRAFWELVNNQKIYKRISKDNLTNILSKEPYIIHNILSHRSIVVHYNNELKHFLLSYPKSAEILLSYYEVKDEFNNKSKTNIPKSLTIEDKESIITKYLDSNDANLNYIELIPNIRNQKEFRVSDKTRLKAKRLHKSESEKVFSDNSGGISYGVDICFPKNSKNIKDGFIDKNHIAHYSYSLDFITNNKKPYSLFNNFKILFEYLDNQNRISLVSKKSELGTLERIMGIHSHNEYRSGISFSFSEMTSHAQIFEYNKIIQKLNSSLEEILHSVFTSKFQVEYNFATNARFSIPTASSYFDKVRLLAPEFESSLKQFKLFVEDGNIDFELLQISSTPLEIRDIPSLNKDKYLYFNKSNDIMLSCSNLFFSDQTTLTYIDPFKDKNYHTFFDLLSKEQVEFAKYEKHHLPRLEYLKKNNFISIDNNGFIKVTNTERLIILKDLYDNEVGSYYHYPVNFQKEANKMAEENIIYFESSLFSKPEQAYLNYFLNKKEFTNGLDLRNSYLHGTQAISDDIQKHEYAYFTYLKLIFLSFLKIEDDLQISKVLN